MSEKYEEIRVQENAIYEAIEQISIPAAKSTGNDVFDRALDWLCQDTEAVLDFGCGHGTLIFLCSIRGTKNHTGIDISDIAIRIAEKRKLSTSNGTFAFIDGGLEKLSDIQDSTFDAVILSNVVDNLYPEDARSLLLHINRILKTSGKVLVKLNPYITKEQMEEWGITVIKDNLLNDGFYLWNNTTEEWRDILSAGFEITDYQEIYYPEHDMYNRLFLLTKSSK
ncbi:class I SAM-dependent methyltransferase [Anaerocolumna xylanovorans]|uniref:Methyltransferase domain-containing protein n=1 Tax=Anaerocolumna xylanovorans DSM 12503 TaxID=1121345 RepID=A0A1M7YG68_9FIRM|nr:class I SAM-dependent methyltransferase [Anaerocolumna xylanovorans]SHO51508.1 Methyltransferase domain-containing protein [Anaerocolumna xylanovorans DSM 12503]